MVVDLSLACTRYDWTRPLWDGTVEPEGIDLHVVDYHNPERFARMIKHGEFDICELSLGSYLASIAHDADYPFTAIPVFPYRKFRHAFVYKRAGDDLELTGLDHADVGLIHWQTTTAIWQRGIASEHYGVDLETITWHATKAEGDVVPIDVPDRFDVRRRHRPGPVTEVFEAMLADGEIDAAFATAPLDAPVTGGRHDRLEGRGGRGKPEVERIFDDARRVEEAYYEETGIFPPMHTIVLSDAVVEAHPWVANKVYDAFERSLDVCMARLSKPRWFPLAWANQYVDHQREVLGENPWAYGLTDANVTAIETLQDYAAAQGIIPVPYGLDTLFVDSTLR